MKQGWSLKALMMLMLTFCSIAFAQDFKRHTVVKGETVLQIAQKYKVTPFDIYRLNPDKQSGIRENDVILIPMIVSSSQQKSDSKITHTAKAKETLFSIARQYNVTVDAIQAANPVLSQGLKVGQVIVIPSGSPSPVVKTSSAFQKPLSHTVQPKETKFGIAKKYGITVADLERMNPGIVQNLPVGYTLVLSSSGQTVEKPQPQTTVITSAPTETTEIIRTTKKTPYANYEVKPKETMYSLTQMFEISEEELIRLNPILKDGVQIGMILKVPGKGSIVMQPSKGFDDLSQTTTSKERKRLVMLIPFNAGRIQGDTAKSIGERLKKDAFLNMTLDFYSGALMAIDSAKTLGLNVDVRIYDSAESKNGSNVVSLIEREKIADADAVIGPFYQQYAEKTAELLADKNIPVISPLSKEAGKPYPNLYQAMPPTDISRSAIFEYMMSKGGNIVVVSDPKKAANREFITQNYPDAKFSQLSDNGTLSAENLRQLLVKDKVNYVVIDSEKTGMILSTTNVLLNEMANYQIQLAIIEPNETLDFEEISMKRLTILKMISPSLIRENHSPEAVRFEESYRRENKIYPNQYAVRGFDVTFDTILRLSQDKSFTASASEDATQQIESKFSYVGKGADGFVNKGVYILQYNEDLSVTEAN